MTRILGSLSWWESAGIVAPTRAQVAFGARYTVNGHFNNIVGALHSSEWVTYPSPNCLSLTDAGRAQTMLVSNAPSLREFEERVRSCLKKAPLIRIFDALLEARRATREDLAEKAGYTVNGHFNNCVGRLHGLEIADYPEPGVVALSEMFDALN